MSNTLKAVVIFQVSGTQTAFNFGFDYLRPSFIKVTVNGIQVYNYVLNGRQINFDEAPIGILRIERETPTDRIVEWAAGSVLKSTDMTISQVQQLHIIEETSDELIENSIVIDDNTGQWQGRGHRITNIADPVDAQDVVTKNYIESVRAGFISAMTSTKDACISALNTTKDSVIATLNSTKDSAITTINGIVTTATNTLTSAKNEALSLIDNAKAGALSAITTLKDSTMSAMNTIKADVDTLKNTATTQADIATTKASEATTQANRATTEADRAYAEANRAEAAADTADMSNYYNKTQTDALIPTSLPANGGTATTANNIPTSDVGGNIWIA